MLQRVLSAVCLNKYRKSSRANILDCGIRTSHGYSRHSVYYYSDNNATDNIAQQGRMVGLYPLHCFQFCGNPAAKMHLALFIILAVGM